MSDTNPSKDELQRLRLVAAELEDEVTTLRRRLQDAPKRVRTLEERLLEAVGPEKVSEAQEVMRIGQLSWRMRDDDNLLLGRIEGELLRALDIAAQRLRGRGRLLSPQVHVREQHLSTIVDALEDANGEEVRLTRGEFELLRALSEMPGYVLTRDNLLDEISHREWEVLDRTVDVLIGRLRRKIEENPKDPSFILTVHGVGYVFSRGKTRS